MPRSFPASVQLRPLMSLMQLLAAPLSKDCPDEQPAWAQLNAVSRLPAQAEVMPWTWHELALLQTAWANELHAATGLLVSELPQAEARMDSDATARIFRMLPPGESCRPAGTGSPQ